MEVPHVLDPLLTFLPVQSMVTGVAGVLGQFVTMGVRRLEVDLVTILLRSMEEAIVLDHQIRHPVVHVMEDGHVVPLLTNVMLIKETVTLMQIVRLV